MTKWFVRDSTHTTFRDVVLEDNTFVTRVGRAFAELIVREHNTIDTVRNWKPNCESFIVIPLANKLSPQQFYRLGHLLHQAIEEAGDNLADTFAEMCLL